MSFFSDLFEGNFGNLGNDITHAPSSLINHPDELAETGAAALLVAAPWLLPEAGAALGATELGIGAADIGAGAADLGLGAAAADAGAAAADLTAADAAFGAFDPALFAANAADVAAGGLGTDALSLLPAVGADLGGGSLAFAPDITGGLADAGLVDTGTSLDTLAPFADAGPDAGLTALQAPDAATAAAPATVGDVPSGSLSDNAFGASAGAGGGGGGGLAAQLGINDIGTAGAAGGGGLTSQLGSVLSSPWTKLGLAAAPLGLALLRGEASLPAAAGQAQANAAQLASFGSQQLAMGQAGQLNAGQMALIAQSRNNLTNAARQAMFNMGVQNPEADSRWPQMLANIDTQVTAMTAQMIQQEITNGLQALGQSSQTLNQIAQMQMQADQNFTNTLVNATKALGLAAGGGLISRTTTTTQAAA